MIDRPILMLGTGRSGTTLYFDLLARHPDLGWFSNWQDRLPRAPGLALLSRLRELPGADRLVEAGVRGIPKPSESWQVLVDLTDGAIDEPRLLGAADVTERVRRRFRRAVEATLALQGKPRFIHKHTGFARTDYLGEIFPDARFIEVFRDGRAVASSLLKVDWWDAEASWNWGEMSETDRERYERSGRDRLVLAGLAWNTLMDRIAEETATLGPERFLRLRYDALIADLDGHLERTLAFCGLEPRPEFLERVRRVSISNMDEKWKRDLDADQQRRLLDVIGPHLEKYGFAP